MPPKSKKTGTRTAAFGSPGRVNHDSRAFYGKKLYAGLPQEVEAPYLENELLETAKNTIFCRSSEKMVELPDSCVHLMVTSPPYNVGKDYDEDFTLEEYLEFLKGVWREVHRVLVPGGRACINVANLGRKPYIPLHAYIARDMADLGFLMRGEIIWDKGASAAASTAWGSWRSPANPTLRDTHEYILVFSKGSFKRQNPTKKKVTISRADFLEFTKSVWTIPAESARNVGHPAPYPVKLPQRLIQLYTYKNDTVLDPFMGSGSTAIAAIYCKRHYVGYENNWEYWQLAKNRIENYELELYRASLKKRRG